MTRKKPTLSFVASSKVRRKNWSQNNEDVELSWFFDFSKDTHWCSYSCSCQTRSRICCCRTCSPSRRIGLACHTFLLQNQMMLYSKNMHTPGGNHILGQTFNTCSSSHMRPVVMNKIVKARRNIVCFGLYRWCYLFAFSWSCTDCTKSREKRISSAMLHLW